MADLLQITTKGLYCPAGNFYVDPWMPVDKAVITHGHADHARPGSREYLAAEPARPVLSVRLGNEASIETLRYCETRTVNGVAVSFHPAGHLLGSAQVRLEHRGQVWVVSGDYKTHSDPTCADFEPVPCHTFITESTFGLPIYRWPDPARVFEEINAWWRGNQERGWTSVLFSYALGKAQRLLAGIDPSIGPILVHGSIPPLNEAYRQGGIALPEVERANQENSKVTRGRALVLAPPSTLGTPWLRKFSPMSLAMASGWMRIRGTRRRRSMDRGFVLSDHADWPGLLETIEATGAERIGVTHGYTAQMIQWLQEQGRDAFAIPTRFIGEEEDATAKEEPED